MRERLRMNECVVFLFNKTFVNIKYKEICAQDADFVVRVIVSLFLAAFIAKNKLP